MLNNIGFFDSAKMVEQALDICTDSNSKLRVTGFKFCLCLVIIGNNLRS